MKLFRQKKLGKVKNNAFLQIDFFGNLVIKNFSNCFYLKLHFNECILMNINIFI